MDLEGADVLGAQLNEDDSQLRRLKETMKTKMLMLKTLAVAILTVGFVANAFATAQQGERLLYKGATIGSPAAPVSLGPSL